MSVYVFPYAGPSHKVLAYLEYNGIPHTATNVSYFNKKELFFSQDYKKVPIALVGGAQVNDSADILKKLNGKTWATPYNKTAMTLIDKELSPALGALQVENIFEHVAAQGLIEKVLMPIAAYTIMPSKYRAAHGDKFDSSRVAPILEQTFKSLDGFSLNPYTSTSEIALFGVLRTVYVIFFFAFLQKKIFVSSFSRHLKQIDAVLEDLGKKEWYDKMDQKCKDNKNLVVRSAAGEPTASKCPFAKKA